MQYFYISLAVAIGMVTGQLTLGTVMVLLERLDKRRRKRTADEQFNELMTTLAAIHPETVAGANSNARIRTSASNGSN